MTINDFAKAIAKREGKKVQMNIAQIKEQLKITNDLTDNILYSVIRLISKSKVFKVL